MKKIDRKYLIVLVWLGAMLLAPCFALGSVNSAGPWTYEVTEKWTAMYGSIAGVPNLQNGVAVAVFGKNGACFGAGFYYGQYYYLSAFEEDKGDKTQDDFSIPGFNPGDEVVFKVYSDKEYTLAPASGKPYTYASNGMFPPLRMDLVYNSDSGTPPPGGNNPPPAGNNTPNENGTGGASTTPMGVWALAPEKAGTGGAGDSGSSSEEGGGKSSSGRVTVYGEGSSPQSPDRIAQGAGYDSGYAASWGEMKKPGQKTEGDIKTDYKGLFDDLDKEYSRKPAKEPVDLSKPEKNPRKRMSAMLKFLLAFVLPALVTAGVSTKVCMS